MDEESTSAQHRLARQSLARPLTAEERTLAAALERIFASGDHDFSSVAAALQQAKVPRPSQSGGPWTVEVLEGELRRINAALDEAYEKNAAARQHSLY